MRASMQLRATFTLQALAAWLAVKSALEEGSQVFALLAWAAH
jgi:hypothetical protein